MDSKNVIAAIALSSAVIVLYSLFFMPEKPVTNKNLIQDLAKSFALFKRKAKRGKSSAFLEEGELRALDTITKLSNEDERSPGLIQFLRDSLAQKMGQRVPTKIIEDKN